MALCLTRILRRGGLAAGWGLGASLALPGAPVPGPVQAAIDDRCSTCHDDEQKKGNLDLTSLEYQPDDPLNFARWVKVFDRVNSHEMPPKKKTPLTPAEWQAFTRSLSDALTAAETARTARDGRATQRRLNRYEYENALRDLLQAPWLQVRDSLPEDGEAFRFNKVGEALDVSHVQMARYLNAADAALRQVMARQPERPATKVTRYYAREQRSFIGPMKFTVFNTSPERATFPMLGEQPQPEVRAGRAPITVGAADPDRRNEEGVGLVASTYEPIEIKFDRFRAPAAGYYRLRFNAFSVWVGPGKDPTGPGKPPRWWIPDFDTISRGRRSEPITVYSETPPRLLRELGTFDITPEPEVRELDVWLLAGETIRPDAARLFRSRPGAARFQNPLAERDGCPGVVFRWLEVEGPILDRWPTAGERLLFGDLPLKKAAHPGQSAEVVSTDPAADAERLLRAFVAQAYRRPVDDTEVRRFLPVVAGTLQTGGSFADAMIAGYTAVLCSPEFLYLIEAPGRLDDYALAARLSFFLWNSPPDAALRAMAARGDLHRPAVLAAQTNRMLDDPKSERFVAAFLDYWLDLRKIVETAPDSGLYPDYYLDDLLSESALAESRLFFADLLRRNLPARNVVSSDFTYVNERLAAHYGLPPVEGVALRRVNLPPDSPRGGLLTQASVLKVTANGTTTSPVLRGVWIMERILGQPRTPPPPGVPALDPDIRGAHTIREQLALHRSQASCAACHAKFDPAGFALESFDVMGGWRDRYRATGGGPPEEGIGHNGQKFAFNEALPVDCSGQLLDGRKFADIREFKRLLLQDERGIARNLATQLTVYATGAPIRFSDRAPLEQILRQSAPDDYGVRSLVQAIVQSPLFLNK